MANAHLIRDDLPESFYLALYSDVHVGAKSFHEAAFRAMLEKGKQRKNSYFAFLGDAVEGQTTSHPHYDHSSVDHHPNYDLHKPSGQFEYFTDLLRPTADKHLLLLEGNHDWRHSQTIPFMRDVVCKALRVPFGGTEAYMTLNGINFYVAHKGNRLPRGAKDERQRRANREAALMRNLESKWASAHMMAHGDTHELIVARPVQDPMFLMSNPVGDSRMRVVPRTLMGATTDEGFTYTDPSSRWYAVTGTFRRSGMVQRVTQEDLGKHVWTDYSQREAYSPTAIGYVEVEVRNGRIHDAVEVLM